MVTSDDVYYKENFISVEPVYTEDCASPVATSPTESIVGHTTLTKFECRIEVESYAEAADFIEHCLQDYFGEEGEIEIVEIATDINDGVATIIGEYESFKHFADMGY